MSRRIIQVRLKRTKEKATANWDLAFEYEKNTVLCDKFIAQAIQADRLVAKLQRKL